MTNQPTSLQEILTKVITRETHSGSVNRVRIQTEAEILAWIKAKAPKRYRDKELQSSDGRQFANGYNAGVDDFLEALEAKDVED